MNLTHMTVVKVTSTENITQACIEERQVKVDELKLENKTDGISQFDHDTKTMTLKWVSEESAQEWIEYVLGLCAKYNTEIISSQVKVIE